MLGLDVHCIAAPASLLQYNCGKYVIGNTGGQTSHAHNVTIAPKQLKIKHLPSHHHNITRNYWDIDCGGGGSKYRVLCANSDGSRNINTNYIGDNEPHDHGSYCTTASNLPPFITLGFIIKV